MTDINRDLLFVILGVNMGVMVAVLHTTDIQFNTLEPNLQVALGVAFLSLLMPFIGALTEATEDE